MIEIVLKLKCDRCLSVFGYRHTRDPLKKGEIAEARSEASAKGWARCRPTTAACMGDFCPRCLKKLADEKAKAKAR